MRALCCAALALVFLANASSELRKETKSPKGKGTKVTTWYRGDSKVLETAHIVSPEGQMIMHKVFHAGAKVFEYSVTELNDTFGGGLRFFGGKDLGVAVEYNDDRLPKFIAVAKDDLTMLDGFRVEDDFLIPIETAEIQRYNAMLRDTHALFSPENIENSTPEEFSKQALDIIMKHRKSEKTNAAPTGADQ